jgi:hypothetical protein
LAYGIEFLLALQTSLPVWTQVDGQGHLDLIPWYTKLGCMVAISYCIVKLTAAAVGAGNYWNRRSRIWLGGLLAVAALMAGITYFYHLHEPIDDQNDGERASTSAEVHPT